jgi:Concanavalin A-like lectin/glucanases superfamily
MVHPRRVASPLLGWPLWCWLATSGCGGGAPAVSPFGAANLALSFDGVSEYATAGNGGFPAASAVQTVEMWVDFPAPSATTTVDFLTMRMDLTSGMEIGIHNGALAIWRVYVDRVLAQAPTLPSANNWHHLAYTYDLTNNTLYVDGVSVDAEMTATDDRTPSTVWLGTLDGASQLYAGRLDEVRVWTLVRSPAEIQADMKHSPPGAVPGLVAYWTFDDGADTGRALDASGSGNDVTLGDGIAANMPTRVPSTAPDGQ